MNTLKRMNTHRRQSSDFSLSDNLSSTTRHAVSAGRTFGQKRHRFAFTLIEIMLAMAIFAIALAAIYAIWSLIIHGSKTGIEAAARAQRERIAVRTIEETLGSVRSFAADLDHYSFVLENGPQATLSFVARLPASFPRGGKFGDFDVRRVMFSLENLPDGKRALTLRQWPVLMDIDQDEQEHPLVLAKNVKDFIIEAWDARQEDWIDTWEQTNQIPALLKVSLTFNAPGDDPYAKPIEAVTRVMALPSVTVPPTWQIPPAQRGGVNRINPGPGGTPVIRRPPNQINPGGNRIQLR
jgi:type II secretion system protein J